ncbi:MAG TPA: hypothetical protein DDW17_06950 [Deltaproteobacteria bacterium]|nr:hypothetical protein [Deltaproteobacteria bacterium]
MIAHVALPIPITKTFSYTVPSLWQPYIKPFVRVLVPFTNRRLTGYVVGIEEEDDKNLKEIHDIIDIIPLIDHTMASLCEWASRYYITPIGMVLKYAIPASLQPDRYLLIHKQKGGSIKLEGISLNRACKLYKKETIFKYLEEGAIELRDIFTGEPFFAPLIQSTGTTEPEHVLFIGPVQSRLEYYLTHISKAFKEGGNVLMMLPDYSMTGTYFYNLLNKEFPGRVYWYGTAIKSKARMATYFHARHGKGMVILGNKNCVFLPIAHNSLIIVERHEEDDYRNEEGFRFNAGQVALQRAAIENIPVIAGSASASVELFNRVKNGKFKIIERPLTPFKEYHEIVTKKYRSPFGAIPEEFIDTVKSGVERKERIAIFTPRRDYSSLIQCLDCRKILRCHVCEGIVSYQKKKDGILCSSCNTLSPYARKCPYCGSAFLRFSHIGVEYIEGLLKEHFKDYLVMGVTAETSKEVMRFFEKHKETIPLILVGTHTLSKLYGIKVERLILFGWEELLKIAGYRAEEKSFHILTNLLDALTPQELYIFMDKKAAINTAPFFNMKAFYEAELRKREEASFPPYGRIFLIEVEKKHSLSGAAIIKKIMEEEGIKDNIIGPVVQKKKRLKWKIIVRGKGERLTQALFRLYDLPGVRIEADPLSI